MKSKKDDVNIDIEELKKRVDEIQRVMNELTNAMEKGTLYDRRLAKMQKENSQYVV